MDLLTPMKAKPGTTRRRWIPGKSMIAVDTIAEKRTKKQIDKTKQNLFIDDNTIWRESNDIDNNNKINEEDFTASESLSGEEEFLSENEDGVG